MNRQQRRQKEREIEKEISVLKKLPAKDLMKISEMVENLSKRKADEALNMIDRSMCGVMIEEGFPLKEISRIQDKISEYIIEDNEKIKLMIKENVDMARLENEVKDFMRGLITAGKARKEVVEETMFKFPKLSKTATNNAYGKILDEIETEKAAEYILEDNKEMKKKVKKAEKKEVKAEPKVEEVKEEIKVEVKEEPKVEVKTETKADDFEVLEEEIIKTIKVKGKNGIYTGNTNTGVVLEWEGFELSFKTKEELKAFYDEFNKVFERI